MRDLTKYRIDLARERCETSKIMIDIGRYKDSINRSYYSIFSSIRALLSEEEVDFKKHSAVIGYFRKNYIKTGIFETKFSDYIEDAFNFRHDCDYADFIIVSKEEAENQYLNAVEFYEAVKSYLESVKESFKI